MSENKRVLVVVDPTIGDARVVRPAVSAVVERRPAEVYVVAPLLESRISWVTNDDAEAIADAEQRLASTLRQLYERDVDASGTVGGDEEILTVIGDALAEFAADEIIIAVHVDHEQHWRERNVAAQIRERHSQPLTELLVDHDGAVSVRSGIPSD
jgi:hypothetical protein